VAELVARPAWAGIDLPTTSGGVTLAAAPEAPMLSLAPFRGRAAAVGDLLGAALPEAGRTARLDDASELIWAGLDLWLLRGPRATPDLAARLADVAAVTDQSDGWTALALTGAGAAAVLARLVPIDLAPAAFPPGAVARTELRHMMCVILAREDGVELFVMRSFTESAAHEIATAMRAVAARAQLGAH
jgi:heterotetrameric sarcosine oxidase gamma subunit